MPDHADPGRPTPSRELLFEERLTVPWWWWLVGMGVAALLAAEVHMGYPGVRAWLPYLVTVPLACAVLLRMSRHRVRVNQGELWVGPAHIPLRYLGRVEVIPPQRKRVTLGPELDPAAYMRHSPWVKHLVRVELIDPDDVTPYWVFSVRRAEELAAILLAESAARAGSHGLTAHSGASDGSGGGSGHDSDRGDDSGGDDSGGHSTGR